MINNTCIVRTSFYDRSAMLQLSLEFQRLAKENTHYKTYIFIDPHPENGYVKEYDDVINNEYVRINWPRNSGAYCWYDAVKYIFNNTKYEYVISIEDDIVISKDYLELCRNIKESDIFNKHNILFFHSGGLYNKRIGYKNKNLITRDNAASRSILISKEKFKLIDKYVKNETFDDNDNLLSKVLNKNNATAISPDLGRDGHFGVYGFSACKKHKNIDGQISVFEKKISHNEMYTLLKSVCLNRNALLKINGYKTPNYFWNFNPNIQFNILQYDI